MGHQRIEGNSNVQIQGVVGSRIQITYNSVSRTVPLEPAHVPVARKLRSPARLVRAHAGVIPYVDRGGLIEGLEAWVDSGAAFSGHVVGGRGGAGKTRLAVELCQRLEKSRWLCGFLTRIADEGMLDALVEAPLPRLVVIDYAETRPEQLELLLPLLSAKATVGYPVRALLLVRGGAEEQEGWAARLADRVDSLDAVLDECEVRRLEDAPFGAGERRTLFEAAVPALAARADPQLESAAAAPDLSQETFASPLMVVIAAYLAAVGKSAPSTREELLDGLIAHERRYWREGAVELGADDVLLERLVALATLVGAGSEKQAERRVGLIPDLEDASAERRSRLARWVRTQYPGPRWWSPLEPDLVGEHLVARCFTDQPAVLRSALAVEDTEEITRPLEVLARAAADHPRLAEALAPILNEELERLCRLAIAQAEAVRDGDLLYGKAATVAAAINALLAPVEVDTEALRDAAFLIPPRPDLVLNDLAITLERLFAERLRPLAEEEPDAYAPDLAVAMNNLSNRLAGAGRHSEALDAVEEAVAIYRPLAAADPGAYAPYLAGALNNMTGELAADEQGPEALAAVEEAVAIYRSLAKAQPDTHVSSLAGALSNLSNRLAEARRHPDALAAIEESVRMRRGLAEADPSAHTLQLARALNNLSNCLARVEKPAEALIAVEQATAIYRPLGQANPAAFAPDCAKVLGNLSKCLAATGRHPEALEAVEEAVAIYRPLAEADPVAFGQSLRWALDDLDALRSVVGQAH